MMVKILLMVTFANIFTIIQPVIDSGDWSSTLWMVGGPIFPVANSVAWPHKTSADSSKSTEGDCGYSGESRDSIVVLLMVTFANIFTIIQPVIDSGDWSSTLWMVGGPM
jgi:hypothetical protein